MRRAAGYALVGLIAFVLAANVVNRFGHDWGIGLLSLCGLATFISTDRARFLIGLFRRQVERHMAHKEAAYTMGQHPSHLSNGFSMKEHLSFTRAAELPDVVWEDFCKTYLEDRGFVVVPSGRLASMVQTVRTLAAAIDARDSSLRSRQGVA